MILQQPFSMSLAHLQRSKHTRPLRSHLPPAAWWRAAGSLRPPSSPSSPWKLVFLTNHSSCPLLSLPPTPTPPSPSPGDRDQHQTEGVWSTWGGGEEKESNMSDFGKCSENTPPASERKGQRLELIYIPEPPPLSSPHTNVPGENEWQSVLMTILDSNE